MSVQDERARVKAVGGVIKNKSKGDKKGGRRKKGVCVCVCFVVLRVCVCV